MWFDLFQLWQLKKALMGRKEEAAAKFAPCLKGVYTDSILLF